MSPRKMRAKVILAAALAALLSGPVHSQQVVPAGQLRLAGVPVNCGGVPTAIQPIGDIAMARPGWIILNPSLFSMPPVLQLFIYAHECGHHVVGANESAADCWAIRLGRNQGWFRPRDFNWLIGYFGGNPGDWTHAPGHERVRRMSACFSS